MDIKDNKEVTQQRAINDDRETVQPCGEDRQPCRDDHVDVQLNGEALWPYVSNSEAIC